MSNIVLPLYWEKIPKADFLNINCLWEARFPVIISVHRIIRYRYSVFKQTNNKFRCCFQHDAWDNNPSYSIWTERDFSTVEEAKAFCDERHKELVLSMLSPEAVQLLLKHDF